MEPANVLSAIPSVNLPDFGRLTSKRERRNEDAMPSLTSLVFSRAWAAPLKLHQYLISPSKLLLGVLERRKADELDHFAKFCQVLVAVSNPRLHVVGYIPFIPAPSFETPSSDCPRYQAGGLPER